MFDIYDLYLLAITAADVLLWRNKKISSSVLAVATAVWVFFEWLDYHFLTIACFVLVLGMVVQFAWSTFAGMLNGYETWKKFSASCVVRENLVSNLCTFRSPSKVPRVELPDELFANIGSAIGTQVNKFLGTLQDVSCGRDLKNFLLVWSAAMFIVISSVCHQCAQCCNIRASFLSGDCRVLRGRYHWELVQSPHCHLHWY